ncbi:putative membrane protein [Thioflavicoccus mobilis 8321]|uniref:Putative membrane protein n=1 Tax=Thioflavicoccus mobilis 8321 TaxID=765912 RepID=L0GW21_9GAMM|nr:DUF202 domain-containing protein [Thioflavicoccus mobilis]AGA90022.1 putative membrane protein [Thioflavicoccus mobilis 8321]
MSVTADPDPSAELPPPYSEAGEALILRDLLAIDRTRLANERTLLAWLRTGLMLLISGVTLIKLFAGQPSLEVPGYALMPAGLAAALYGWLRFERTRRRIASITQR